MQQRDLHFSEHQNGSSQGECWIYEAGHSRQARDCILLYQSRSARETRPPRMRLKSRFDNVNTTAHCEYSTLARISLMNDFSGSKN